MHTMPSPAATGPSEKRSANVSTTSEHASVQPMRLSGLEPVLIGQGSLFVNIGERTNVTGSKAFARMILNGDFEQALAVARQQVENGAQIIDINMDDGILDAEAALDRFLRPVALHDAPAWLLQRQGRPC